MVGECRCTSGGGIGDDIVVVARLVLAIYVEEGDKGGQRVVVVVV